MGHGGALHLALVGPLSWALEGPLPWALMGPLPWALVEPSHEPWWDRPLGPCVALPRALALALVGLPP